MHGADKNVPSSGKRKELLSQNIFHFDVRHLHQPEGDLGGSQEICHAASKHLSQRPTTSGGASSWGIDLPGGQVGNLHLTSFRVPTEADIDMGNILAILR